MKKGEHGVLMFTEQGSFAAPAYPLEEDLTIDLKGRDSVAGGEAERVIQAALAWASAVDAKAVAWKAEPGIWTVADHRLGDARDAGEQYRENGARGAGSRAG